MPKHWLFAGSADALAMAVVAQVDEFNEDKWIHSTTWKTSEKYDSFGSMEQNKINDQLITFRGSTYGILTTILNKQKVFPWINHKMINYG